MTPRNSGQYANSSETPPKLVGPPTISGCGLKMSWAVRCTLYAARCTPHAVRWPPGTVRYCTLSILSAILSVIRVPPLSLARWPPKVAANTCGHPANFSGPYLGATPLMLAGVPLTTRGVGVRNFSGVDTGRPERMPFEGSNSGN